jgi:peptide deformylase
MLVREMFDLMYSDEHRGIGLAANQVDLPYRLFVVNLTSDPALRDQEFVFINPVLSQPKSSAEAEEGCLSLPGLYAQVRRPEKITINAYNLSGQEVTFELDDLFARVVQHETDHLDGVLFIDRLSPTARLAVQDALEDFREEFASQRERGEIPSDEKILERLAELEQKRT